MVVMVTIVPRDPVETGVRRSFLYKEVFYHPQPSIPMPHRPTLLGWWGT